MLKTILDWLGGGVVKQFTDPLLAAYQAKLNAQNDADRLEADLIIARIEAARNIALAEAGRAWSATSVGRWLIVVPWGLHWALIYLVSIINPNLGTAFVIQAVPSHINEAALVLIPAIVLADAGVLVSRQFRR